MDFVRIPEKLKSVKKSVSVCKKVNRGESSVVVLVLDRYQSTRSGNSRKSRKQVKKLESKKSATAAAVIGNFGRQTSSSNSKEKGYATNLTHSFHLKKEKNKTGGRR